MANEEDGDILLGQNRTMSLRPQSSRTITEAKTTPLSFWGMDHTYEHELMKVGGDDGQEEFTNIGVSPNRNFIISGDKNGHLYVRDMSPRDEDEDGSSGKVYSIEIPSDYRKEKSKPGFGHGLVFEGEDPMARKSHTRGAKAYLALAGGEILSIDLEKKGGGRCLRYFDAHEKRVECLTLR